MKTTTKEETEQARKEFRKWFIDNNTTLYSHCGNRSLYLRVYKAIYKTWYFDFGKAEDVKNKNFQKWLK